MTIIEFDQKTGDGIKKLSINPIQVCRVENTPNGVFLITLFDYSNNPVGYQEFYLDNKYPAVKSALILSGLPFFELTQLPSQYKVLYNAIQIVGITPFIKGHTIYCQIYQNALGNTTYVQESYATVKTIIEGL